nr:LysR family transcriptional regulator [Bacteriovorax sp. HI3]
MQNFNHLYYFYTVAKLRSVTAAAKHLNTSQPSLSTQIKTLELNLDKTLFIKKGKYLELTNDGINIFEICSRMFEVYEELENYVKKEAQNSNQIVVGVCGEISRPFTTKIIAQVLKKFTAKNRPRIKLDTGNHETLIQKLKIKKLDFILTNMPTTDIDLKTLKTFPMPVVLAGKSELIEDLKLSSLKKPETILKKASGHLSLPAEETKLRIETNKFFVKNKIKYSPLFESDILASLVQSAIDGIGMCLIPLPYIKREINSGLIKIPTGASSLWKHNIYIISRSSIDKKQFINKLIGEIEAAV